jgi:hypothetical protein
VEGQPLTPYILDMFDDSRGRFWLGSNRSLTILEWPGGDGPPRSVSFSARDGLAGGNVYAISEDSLGRRCTPTSTRSIVARPRRPWR